MKETDPDRRIDIAKDVVTSIYNREIEPVISSEICIMVAPESFGKDENLHIYAPRLIYIGPIHHRERDGMQLEKQKYSYFKFFCQRLGEEWRQKLASFTTRLSDGEENICKYYGPGHNYFGLHSENQYYLGRNLRPTLLDAVFIMELFLRNWEGPPLINDDYLFANHDLSKNIKRELLLIENQLPFFVLERLYEFVRPGHPGSERHSSFLELARNYFSSYDPYPRMSIDDISKEMKLMEGWDKPKHLTDLVRYFLLPHDLIYEGPSTTIIKPASKLKLAGITFEPVSGGCLLEVKFKKIPILNRLSCLLCNTKRAYARLQIPTLEVDSSTESVLHNLITFEKHCYPKYSYISNYITFLGYLIETKEDLDLLVESGVIIVRLQPYEEDFLGILQRLVKQCAVTSVCYGTLSRKLEEHYNNSWNRGMAIIRLVYFKDASRTAATISGLIVLAFSIVSLFSALKQLNAKLFS